jgi:hypothetical protein
MMEYRMNGMLEYWNDGMVEDWNNAALTSTWENIEIMLSGAKLPQTNRFDRKNIEVFIPK